MTIEYGPLAPQDFARFAEIDRSEHIEQRYRSSGGELILQPHHFDVPGWYPGEVDQHIGRLHAVADAGGAVFEARLEEAVVGVGSLDVRLVGGNPTVMKLDLLYVSRPHRGHGIGHRLTWLIAERARRLGATALYISATPTRNTVDAYLGMGAAVLASPDPTLLAVEPDDIHHILPIRAPGGRVS